MFARYIVSDWNDGILDGVLVSNLEAGEVVPTYETLNLFDVLRAGSLVRLGVVDPLGLGYQSSGGFPYALSETDSSRDVAGYRSATLPLQKMAKLPLLIWAREMAECARQLVLEPYLALLNDVRSSSHYVRSLKIFLNLFLALINQLPSCFVLCLYIYIFYSHKV